MEVPIFTAGVLRFSWQDGKAAGTRLGIGAVLGYWLAGLHVSGAGVISDVDEILRFSELGGILLMLYHRSELNFSKSLGNCNYFYR